MPLFEALFENLGLAALAVFILVPLWKGDDFLYGQLRHDLRDWLLSLRVPSRNLIPRVIDSFFIHFFGSSIISLRSLLMVLAIAVFSSFVGMLSLAGLFGGPTKPFFLSCEALIPFIGLSFFFFLQCLVSYSISRCAVRIAKNLPNTIYAIAILDYAIAAFITVIGSCLIAISFFLPASGGGVLYPLQVVMAIVFGGGGDLLPGYDYHFHGPHPHRDLFIDFLKGSNLFDVMRAPFVSPPNASFPAGFDRIIAELSTPSWFSSFSFSIFIWAVAISAVFTRWSMRLNTFHSYLTYALPLDNKPVRSLSITFAMLVCIVAVVGKSIANLLYLS